MTTESHDDHDGRPLLCLGLGDGLGAASEAPVPPAHCKQCAGSAFDWWGVAAFKCRKCGDVAHWLSAEQREAIRAALEASNAS